MKSAFVYRIRLLAAVAAYTSQLGCNAPADRQEGSVVVDSASQMPEWVFAGYRLGDSWEAVGRALPCSATTLFDRPITECEMGDDSTLVFGPDGTLEEILAVLAYGTADDATSAWRQIAPEMIELLGIPDTVADLGHDGIGWRVTSLWLRKSGQWPGCAKTEVMVSDPPGRVSNARVTLSIGNWQSMTCTVGLSIWNLW